MKGFISGLRAGNYDISHIFIDNFHKMFNAGTEAQVVDFLDWLSSFAESEGIKFTITMTARPRQRRGGDQEIRDVNTDRRPANRAAVFCVCGWSGGFGFGGTRRFAGG